MRISDWSSDVCSSDLAKTLLAEAGYPDGFKITMDTRNTSPIMEMAQAIQATFAQAGIELEIIPGNGGQSLPTYRARNPALYIRHWGPDYMEPPPNANTIAPTPATPTHPQPKPLASPT